MKAQHMESAQERSDVVGGYLHSLALVNRTVDFKFLCDAVARHVGTFAFCSMGCWLGDALPLDVESLYDRIVVRRRGGYCFEQNGLFYHVLKELGFRVQLYLARVIHNQDIHPGLTHRITVVDYEGQSYVLDVGFGSLGPRIPVPLSGHESIDGEKIFRIMERRLGEYHMQVLQNGEFFSLYRFELVRYGQSDCELGHFYSHRHPDATFVNNLVASLIRENEIRSLRNLEYWVIRESGTENREIENSEQLRHILAGELGVRVTEQECRTVYDRLIT